MKYEVRMGDWIKRGFELYRDNIGLLLLCSLVFFVVSGLTGGLLAGPMLASMAWIALALARGTEPAPSINDIFKGFDNFLQTFLFGLVWGLVGASACAGISVILFCVPFVPGMVLMTFLSTLLMYGIFLVVDKHMDFWPASLESMRIVLNNFWAFLGFAVVSMILGDLGMIACGIGVVLTAPITVCIWAVSYMDISGRSDGVIEGEVVEDPAGS